MIAVNIFLLAYEMTGRLWIALAVWAALAFSSPLMTYSYLIFTELPTGLLLIYAFRRLALGWAANGPWRRLLVGACIGYIPWVAWRALPIAGLLVLYAAVQWWRALARGGRRPRRAAPGVAARPARRQAGCWAPLAVSTLLLTAYNLFLYGRVFADTGTLVEGREIFYWPWAGAPERLRFVTNAFGLLFDIQ